ncbi:hypothetical protein LEP1GSC058_0213 [Leptospira fainei serovar Hurstbridge str. BUT 6]|uniref:Uncharacterized protein n=1 Tax=Leptospira fainei serovar Hurstbridge str. BUT 6 TaxID=1193011 RepID=S3UT11_9LEPT|nr:hypothetical protein LEP1GSC058_0213 [Leptospira fainei serovar Hurstbridge str. BUT 6]
MIAYGVRSQIFAPLVLVLTKSQGRQLKYPNKKIGNREVSDRGFSLYKPQGDVLINLGWRLRRRMSGFPLSMYYNGIFARNR